MMRRRKLLVVSPHFSTGGAPQVTLSKIRMLIDDFEIKVVEHSFLSSHYVVQRNQVMKLVGIDNFHTLNGTQNEKGQELYHIVQNFRPDYISMEEFPEMFMDIEWAKKIYFTAAHTITETTHDSSFPVENKLLMPDQFVFVSAFSAIQYSHLNVPTQVIEYPVDIVTRDKSQIRKALRETHNVDFDDDYTHVVIVGLFTPRKNQKYAFELARQLSEYKIKFHFLGNQADNFGDYWKPLMDDKPSNCVVWGERDDVSMFIQASDLFLFTSKGDKGNKELNPIVIKEAAQYPDLPKLIFNLDVYLNKYNDRPDFHYLLGNVSEDSNAIVRLTNSVSMNILNEEEAIIIGTYPNLKERENLTIECIKSVRPLNRKIILVSHYPVSDEIQRLVDVYIYDKHNPLTHHSYYTRFYNYMPTYDVELNINGLKNSNQSFAVLTNLYNGYKTAKSLGFKRAFYITYDVVVDRNDYKTIEESFSHIYSDIKAYLSAIKTPFGYGIQTTAMTFDVDFFIESFHDVRNADEYNKVCESLSCQNFLEDYMMKVVNRWDKSIYNFIVNEKETFLTHSGLGVSSNSEYYSIVPISDTQNEYMFYFFTYNIDKRVVHVSIKSEGHSTKHVIDIQNNREYKVPIKYNGIPITITLEFYDGSRKYKTEAYGMNSKNIETYRNTGHFKWKARPKIKVLHLQTNLNMDKEVQSREQLQKVKDFGWEYVNHSNLPYSDLPPSAMCARPVAISLDLFDEETTKQRGTALTPAHYGCYESFKLGILSEFDNDIDFLIVCEGDCKLEMEVSEFVGKVEASCENVIRNQIGIMSFGDTATLEHGWPQSPMIQDISDDMYVTNHIIGLQAIMFPKSIKKWLFEKLRTALWDASDIYFNNIFSGSPFKMGIVKKRYTSQFDGFSLIDKQVKKFI